MTVDPRLLEILKCPACRGKIGTTPAGALECERCGRVYPVRDGIPVMLVEESAPPTRGEDVKP